MTIRQAALAAVFVAIGGLAVGCTGTHSAAGQRPGRGSDVVLSARSVPGLGRIVVSHGWTLYMYPPDQHRHVTCTSVGDCTTAWPPLLVAAGHSVVAGPGVQQRLIGTMPGDGGRVVTYDHWPLYYYIGDRSADVVNGQGQGFNWYVMDPDGHPNKSHFGSPSG